MAFFQSSKAGQARGEKTLTASGGLRESAIQDPGEHIAEQFAEQGAYTKQQRAEESVAGAEGRSKDGGHYRFAYAQSAGGSGRNKAERPGTDIPEDDPDDEVRVKGQIDPHAPKQHTQDQAGQEKKEHVDGKAARGVDDGPRDGKAKFAANDKIRPTA